MKMADYTSLSSFAIWLFGFGVILKTHFDELKRTRADQKGVKRGQSGD